MMHRTTVSLKNTHTGDPIHPRGLYGRPSLALYGLSLSPRGKALILIFIGCALVWTGVYQLVKVL